MQLSDLIYFLYLDLNEVNNEFLKELVNGDEQKFKTFVHHHFFNLYQEEVFIRVGLKYEMEFSQKQIDSIFKEFAILFHKNIDSTYLKSRDITDTQIEKYLLGSTHCLRDIKIVETFVKQLVKKYPSELVSRVIEFHNTMAQMNQTYFDDPYCSTIPSFDLNGDCHGIAYRTEKYKKQNEIRNLHKFFVSHAPSYIFNAKTYEENQSLILVEGVFDVLALERIGITNAVSMSHTRMSKYQYNQLKSKELTAIYDRDKGGLYGLKSIKQNYKFPKFIDHLVPHDDVDLMIRKNPDEFLRYFNSL